MKPFQRMHCVSLKMVHQNDFGDLGRTISKFGSSSIAPSILIPGRSTVTFVRFSYPRHPGEGRDLSRPQICDELALGWIPAYAGMTLIGRRAFVG